MNKFFMIAILMVILGTYSHAQKPRKFGLITKEELQMTSYAADTTAKAVVLYEFGKSAVNYLSSNQSFEVVFNYHTIIKFFDDDELDRANITIRFPDNTGVSRFKASTYNLIDGKIVESEVSKKDVHTEDLVDGIVEKKFSFPDAKPGSIVEYTYQISTGSVTFLNAWSFQSTIPVAYSEYVISYPDYFNYKTIMKGYITLNTADVKNASLSVGGEVVNGKVHRYVAKNVPAFVSEKYMTTKKNYISKIDFELQSVQFPGYYKDFFSDFNSIQKTLMDDEDFGERLNKVGFMKDEIDSIKSASSDKLSFAKGIYSYVQKHSAWNGDYSKYATDNFKNVLDEETNSGMINLFLTALLKEAGFAADPVILSTRNNGAVNLFYPLIKEYNYVIAQINVDDRTYLLDATDDYMPFGVLPERCLNGKGRLISENTNYWVDLKSLGIRQTMCTATFDLSEDGELDGHLKYNFNGYTSFELKEEITKTGKDELIEKYEENDGWQINSSEITGQDEMPAPLTIDLDVTINDKAEALGDRIYLTPLVVGQTKENPFRLETRQYPVDFTCPIKKIYYFKYKIPEGYEVDALPQPLGIALPNNGGRFIFSVKQEGEYVSATVQYQINQVVFLPTEYQILKEYFSQIVNKEAEQIVLKEKL
ncbi:MAG: DUF3857 domain-containing protein [Cyclobacteriaceae bacterium]|nr:DUF3857 domain-containing protein [Cyclobacteriaceae bacterium]